MSKLIALLILLLLTTGGARAQCPPLPSQKLVPGGGAADEVARSVAVEEGALFVGAHQSDLAAVDAGAVFVYRREGETWVLDQTLLAPDATPGDGFGFSISVCGDVAVIGARHDDVGGLFRAGSAYVYRRVAGTWSFEQKLVPTDHEEDDQFGFSVSVHGETIALGSPFDDDACPEDLWTNSGSAFIFRFDAGSSLWLQEQKLRASDEEAGDWFGVSVSVGDGVVAIGSVFDDDAGPESGSAYVFRRGGAPGSWTEEQKLIASDAGALKKFAKSITLEGNRIVVGSFEGEEMGAGPGAAYSFTHDGISWSEEQRFSASDGEPGDDFGLSVSLDGSTLVVGAFTDDGGRGAAYVFRNADGWVEERKLTAPDGEAGDQFGWAVAVEGPLVLVGAFLDRVAGIDTGSAHVFPDGALPGCGSGTVNVGLGLPADVLTVNGSRGDLHRVVRVETGAPLAVSLAAAPTGPDPARYLLLVWAGPPASCTELRAGARVIGCLVHPTGTLPFRCLRGAGIPVRACAGVVEPPSPTFAPWVRQRPAPGAKAVFTLQAILEDDGAGTTAGFSVSNGVELRIEPQGAR